MTTSSNASPFPAAGRIALWLWLVCTLILLMVAVGGITRLTESGLSMVNWNPIMGTLPPSSPEAWRDAFDQYKATPQYEKFSAEGEMTLAHFKEIFFWEYVHRLLGRVIGIAYAVPLAVFWVRGRIPKGWRWKLLLGLVLGGSQGLLGWYMVKSGLIDKPYVSHFRLAAHFGLALVVLMYLLWLILDLLPFRTHRHTNYLSVRPLRRWTVGFLILLAVQIVYGAFTAGLRAGYIYNTYPLMGGRVLPPEFVSSRFGSVVENLLHNPVAVQFAHRHLGLVVVVAAFALWALALRNRLMPRQKVFYNLIPLMVTIQFLLGIFTLISGMNLPLAVAHQVSACLLSAVAVAALHEVMEPKTVTSRRS